MSELPPGWVWTDTGTVAEVQGGIQKQPKRRPAVNHYPFLRVANVMRGRLDLREVHEIELFNGELEKFRLRVGDLLVVEGNGSPDQIGRAARWHSDIEDCVHQNHLIRVRPSGAIDSNYLTYYWNASRTTEYLRSVASSTSGLYVLTAAKVRGVGIPLPPLREQQRIVAAIEEQFSRLDAGVAALERARQNIRRMLLALTAMADISNVQRGWERVFLADVAKIDSGPAFPSAMFKGPSEGIRLLRGDNIEPGALRWTNTRTWPLDKMQGFEHLHVDAGDLILAMDRPVISSGLKLACVKADDLPALLVQRVARIRPLTDVNSRFLHIALMSPRFVPHLLHSQTGTQLPHITLAGIRSFPLVMPPQDVQMQVAQKFDFLSAQMLDVQKIASIATKRGALLQRAILASAFSGKLVSQNPKDEPASALLERVVAERTSTNGHKSGWPHKIRLLGGEATV